MSVIGFLRGLRSPGRLARNTMLSMFWQMARIGGQALTVIVVARLLGPMGYGTFAGTAGLATALGGLAGLGTGTLLLQSVSRDHASFGRHWRQATVVTWASGLSIALAFSLLASWLLGQHATWPILAAISLSELVFYPLVLVASYAFQAHERLGWSSAMPALLAVTRLVAAIGFWLVGSNHDLINFLVWYVTASALVAAFALWLTQRILRPPQVPFEFKLHELSEGLSFSSLWFSSNALTESDKTLALRLGGSELAGLYAAGYRLASVFALPVGALVVAVQPRLFRQYSEKSNADIDLIRGVMLVSLVNSVIAGALLYLAAGALPFLLGDAYVPAVHAARLMALWPLCYSARLIAGNLLMTRGDKLIRVVAECLAVAVLVLLFMACLPRYGLAGAAISVTATEAALAVVMWLIFWRIRRH